MAHLASLWDTAAVRELRRSTPMVSATASMCSFGSDYRMFFTILASVALAGEVDHLRGRLCPRTGVHAQHPPARGYDAWGKSRAAQAGRYPPDLYRWLLRSLWGACNLSVPSTGPRVGPPLDDVSESSSGAEDTEVDNEASSLTGGVGRVAEGPFLHPVVRRRVEAARRVLAGFASVRNMSLASDEELIRSPLLDVVAMAKGLAPRRSPVLPTRRLQWDGSGDWRDLVVGAPRSWGDTVGGHYWRCALG